MSVIPLTLTISLCLVFTFVVFFLREHGRHLGNPERDSVLPFADEHPHVGPSRPAPVPGRRDGP